MNTLKLTAVALAAAFGLNAALAQDAAPALPPVAAKKDVTYATDIKSILDASCINCHTAGKKPKAGVELDTLAGVLKGGNDGKIIVSGDSTKGSLINAVAHIGDPGSFMPKGKDAKPLTP
ncbi:MAG: c-type cytochrome domain-containing protein [Verrucomicrobiota bacterium]